MTDATNQGYAAPAHPPAPPVLRTVTVAVDPDAAFVAFTERIGAWWPLPTHGMFGDTAGGVAFEGGRLVERATDGTAATWGEVVVWDRPRRLVFTWHPGRDPEEHSVVEIRFVGDESGTRVELEHRGWERFGREWMARRRRYVGPGAWGAVLEHYVDVVEPRPDAPERSALEAAYEEFFTEAERGGFGPPPEGEWDADQVIAHVTLNDLAMTAVAHALIHTRTPLFENVICQDRTVLAAHIERFGGDRAALVAEGRRVSAIALAALARLDEGQLAAPVHCRLRHDGQVVLDQTMPWGVVADEVQAGRHLPAHTGQLRDLRVT